MSTQEIASWIAGYLVQLLKVKPEQIDTALTFDNYGIDSKRAAAMVSDLGDLLKRELTLDLVYDYPSIDQLSKYLAETSIGAEP